MIRHFYERGINLQSLKPSIETHNFFFELCNYVKKDDSRNIKITHEIRELNKICALAEYELEKHWSIKIAHAEDPTKELQNFIYYDNYLQLTKLEVINATNIFGELGHMLFIWGGPLPLTSIILALHYGIQSTIIDNSKEAVDASRWLIRALNLDTMIHIELWDARSYESIVHFDLCYIASLVCIWNEQDAIIKNISKLAVNNFLIRTSEDKRQILYKKASERILKKYLKTQMIVHPKNDIINSFILLTQLHDE